MSFLNNTGLAYFYSKLKEKFIQSVNGSAPDSHGNVQINQVSLAENLTSPDAQASIDSFIYRTSGGSASLESGEANLVFINGNMQINGRVAEAWSAQTSNNVVCNINSINQATWRSQVSTTGNTTFTYSVSITDGATSNWTSNGSWSPSLSDYGLSSAISGIVNYSIECARSATGISAATVNPLTFSGTSLGNNSGVYVFNYLEAIEDDESIDNDESQEAGWYYNNTLVTLSNYGIATTDTPVEGDVITITWNKGTPTNTTVIISYTAPIQGILTVAKPTAFQSTGFNQFDKTTMIIENAGIANGSIISNSGTYVCYCPSKGGDHGYAAVSLEGHILTTGNCGMGWCSTQPAIGTTVVTTSENASDSYEAYTGRFTNSADGYIVIVVSDPSDLMMGCAWSDYITDAQELGEYIPYTAPSQILIPTQGYDSEDQLVSLPTATYGIPRLGNVYDTINFDASTYIQRIGYMQYSAGNLVTVKDWYNTYGTPYDYDEGIYDGDTKIRDGYIFYVLDGNSGNPITYTLDTTSIYQVDDHGTEKFTGTTIPVEAELLYGQNLRDKLRTDVVTISEQELLPSQQSQIRTNIQAAPTPLVFTNVAVDSSMFAADTTYNDFRYCGTIALSSVTSNMIPYVAFNGNEASSGDYCPTVATYDGGIYIYANASSNITIPTIMCWRLD